MSLFPLRTRVRALLQWCIAACVLALLSMPSFAGPPMGAGAPAGSRDDAITLGERPGPLAESHTWISAQGTQSPVLLHLPPRSTTVSGDGLAHGAVEGEIRVAQTLSRTPHAVAAWGSRVYLLEEGPPEFTNPAPRRVVSLRAARSGVGDYWTTLPRDRQDSEPNLDGAGRLVAFSGTPLGPAALLLGLTASDTSPRFRMLVLSGSAWRTLELPPEIQAFAKDLWALPSPRDAVQILAGPDRVRLVRIAPDGRISAWQLPVDQEFLARSKGGESVSATWQPEAWPSAAGIVAGDRVRVLETAGQTILAIDRDDSRIALFARTREAWRELALVQAPSASACVAPLDGVGRVAILWAREKSATQKGPQQFEIIEVSAHTGREFFSGPAIVAGAVTHSDMRWIALVLVALMSVVLVFVLRSDGADKGLVLPKGLVLADAPRRAAASLADLGIALLLASQVVDVPISRIIDLGALLDGEVFALLLAALGAAAAIGAASEAAFGRSPGKWLVGLGVVLVPPKSDTPQVRPDEAHMPGPWRATLRNLLKWGLPPLGLLLVLDPAARHPADRVSGTAVVMPESGEDEGV